MTERSDESATNDQQIEITDDGQTLAAAEVSRPTDPRGAPAAGRYEARNARTTGAGTGPQGDRLRQQGPRAHGA